MQSLPVSGVSIDEEFVFILSLVLLSVLSILFIIASVLILWLIKIRHRVEQAIQDGRKLSSPFINNAFSYSDVVVDEDGIDLKQTSFQGNGSNAVTEGSENGPGINSTASAGLVSTSEQLRQSAQCGKRKIYKSLKNPDAEYAKLYEETRTKNACSDCAADCVHKKTDITDEQDYLVLIGDDADQSAKKLQESQVEDQQSGNASKILENNKVDVLMDDDAPQNDYENEYLAVIHSETTSGLPEITENVMPQHEDESAYLVPIETLSTEKRQQSESHPERNPKASGTLERDKRAQASAVATTELVQERQNRATDGFYDVIRDGDNDGYLEVSACEKTSEAIYQNQKDMEELPSTQNPAGVGSSDDGPIYANSNKQS